MTPKEKIEKLKKLCNDYREHLIKTKDQYLTSHATRIYIQKLDALDVLIKAIKGRYLDPGLNPYYSDERYKDEQSIIKPFSVLWIESFSEKLDEVRMVLGANRNIEPAGVVFLKAVATVLSLGTVLLYNNFWKSKGEQESDKMKKVLDEPLELLSVRDRFWRERERFNNRSHGFMGQLVEAFRSSP